MTHTWQSNFSCFMLLYFTKQISNTVFADKRQIYSKLDIAAVNTRCIHYAAVIAVTYVSAAQPLDTAKLL